MTKGELDYAIRQAFNHFDEWNHVTGFVPMGCGYYYEIQGIIEAAVKIGAKIATEGISANLSHILEE